MIFIHIPSLEENVNHFLPVLKFYNVYGLEEIGRKESKLKEIFNFLGIKMWYENQRKSGEIRRNLAT